MDKPLVSLAIFTYKQENFILETLQGAISQDYENLEIILSDDNSPDNTFNIIQDFFKHYNGKHKIVLNHNECNLGLGGHVSKVLTELCHGEYIILHGGDDISLPHRVSYSVDRMISTGVSSMCFNMMKIDEKSQEKELCHKNKTQPEKLYHIEDFINNNYISAGASRIIDRKLIDIFGTINKDCPTEDTVFNLRAFFVNGLGFNYTPLVKYRIHSNNISGFHNLMTKIDPQKIYNQYQKDLSTAKDKSLISDIDYSLIKKHIDYYLYHNVAIRDIYKQPSFLKQLICAFSYMFKKNYTIKQARIYVGMVRKWHNRKKHEAF